mmetsp:Transcript_26203/g.102621  ORF Transcript_26203/g.102621 Transcript_26203/m.102621 type:complete len:367 (-) Transcript_26203:427-1527(-)|eukprot:CAMPEP_0113969664 /NCGR_PEP_ID=MMETSP0011_2-20120614/10503_1 /TAXON_ID=101924 /ORGANISM="Rhodosorus marinus" /LENGTH=366 /DNA_ID=CAMNT_0000983467 /DNA_START=377 /DNA_END=1477 /DNA_ORIENTATION=- /assembly_acc=CAM_ASM_000156
MDADAFVAVGPRQLGSMALSNGCMGPPNEIRIPSPESAVYSKESYPNTSHSLLSFESEIVSSASTLKESDVDATKLPSVSAIYERFANGINSHASHESYSGSQAKRALGKAGVRKRPRGNKSNSARGKGASRTPTEAMGAAYGLDFCSPDEQAGIFELPFRDSISIFPREQRRNKGKGKPLIAPPLTWNGSRSGLSRFRRPLNTPKDDEEGVRKLQRFKPEQKCSEKKGSRKPKGWGDDRPGLARTSSGKGSRGLLILQAAETKNPQVCNEKQEPQAKEDGDEIRVKDAVKDLLLTRSDVAEPLREMLYNICYAVTKSLPANLKGDSTYYRKLLKQVVSSNESILRSALGSTLVDEDSPGLWYFGR